MMDRKLILEFAKKDIDELQLLVEALGKNPDPDHILLEITLARTQTLLSELAMLKSNASGQPVSDLNKGEYSIKKTQHSILQEKDTEVEKETQKTVAAAMVAEELTENDFTDEPVRIGVEEQITTKEAVVEAFETVKKEQKHTIEKAEAIQEQNTDTIHQDSFAINESELKEPINVVETLKAGEKVKLKPEVKEEVEIKKPRLVGENFTKEPSLNERFTEQKDIQPKIKGKPVTSIKAAIGLNDRFMYTRELFDNSSSKFDSTVEHLDKVAGIIKAIEFLEQNFTWQKSETSLKFVELVKRRHES